MNPQNHCSDGRTDGQVGYASTLNLLDGVRIAFYGLMNVN